MSVALHLFEKYARRRDGLLVFRASRARSQAVESENINASVQVTSENGPQGAHQDIVAENMVKMMVKIV